MKPLTQLIETFKNNKFFRTAVIFGMLFLIFVAVLSPKKSSIPAPLPSTVPTAIDTHGRPELTGYEPKRLQEASDYRALIADRLPLYLENFKTSVDITTSINIYYLPSDPVSTVRFEVYGLSFINKDATPLANPNITAFVESYQKGLSGLKERGIDPAQLIFIYGDTEYIRNTAAEWISKYVKI